MELREETVGEVMVLEVKGRVDSTTAPALGERLQGALASAQRRLVLDLRLLEYISSAGFRALLLAAKRAEDGRGGRQRVERHAVVLDLSLQGTAVQAEPDADLTGGAGRIPMGDDVGEHLVEGHVHVLDGRRCQPMAGSEVVQRPRDPRIKNIIINHIENDHVTSIEKIMSLTPHATIYITQKGKKGLERFFDTSKWDMKIVKSGDSLNIGKRTLLFLETPMLHWPDSMITYVKEDKLLISQDGFGQHLASAGRFDDEFISCSSESALEDAVKDYYANILMPFGTLIKNKIAEIQKLGLEIDMIAPDHGIIWRQNPGKNINMYLDMANGKADLRVVIIYDTMWHSTEHMTLPLLHGIKDEGVDVKVVKLRANPISDAVKEFWKARGCLIGSPTLNNSLFPRLTW